MFGHFGWGETLYLRQVWPKARHLIYAEMFYQPRGTDTSFDPELQRHGLEMEMLVATRQAHLLLALNNAFAAHALPMLNVEATLYAFIRKMRLDTGGRTIRTVKEQLARLAAADMRLGISTGPDSATTQKGSIVAEFDLWLEKNEQQRVMWPRTVTLDDWYFRSLVEHAVPLDDRALMSLSGSSMAIDVYAWLAQRLHRVTTDAFIPWVAVYRQFGEGYDRIRDFRRKFLHTLTQVLIHPQ